MRFEQADAAHVRCVLEDAGFARIEEVAEPVDSGAGADDAIAFLGTLGLVKGLTEDLDAETRAHALDSLHAVVQAHQTDEGVLLGSSAWLITATRP